MLLCALLVMTVMPVGPLPASASKRTEPDVEVFRLSGILDVTGEDGSRIYSVYAPDTGIYSVDYLLLKCRVFGTYRIAY